MFSPIVAIPEFTDLSTAYDLTTDWQNVFGQLVPDRRLCLKSALIENSNGLRSIENIVCSNSSPAVANFIEDLDGSLLIDADGTFIISE